MKNYMLSIPINDDLSDGTIHDPNSNLKVKIFDRLNPPFAAVKGEIRYYVTIADKTIAFETEGYHKHRQLLILQMISWYCVYRNMMDARIHADWPLNFAAAGNIKNRKGAI
jgi:hypothetical protein